MHMTGDIKKYVSMKEKKDGTVSFGNVGSSNVIGLGTVTLGSKDSLANNVLLVENMNHNLLSLGKMCDQGHTILFNSTKCEIRKGRYGKIVATASRALNDIYVLDEATKACLIAKEDDTLIGSNDDRLSKKFATNVQSDFKMSLLGCKFSIDNSSKDVDQRFYRSMIGSLLYVTASCQMLCKKLEK